MVAKRKKKYEAGEAARFVTRKQALHKLQLNLKDFRRLCILKGIHPREPRNRKRAQKGDVTRIKTLYHEKDIRFLLHEPIVWKFRDFKVFLKKLKRATSKGDFDTADRLKANKPKYTLDHIVRERYPTFVDAIRDLEDCLCLCFLYSTFPKNTKTPVEMIALCRRLCVEFMHWVIEAKALKKVFVSIKGYYYQAEIMGQTVTWIVPHPAFTYESPQGVDLRLMSIFVEFYTTMLGFVNFRLYHKLNLKYPPTLTTSSQSSSLVPQSKEDAAEGTAEVKVPATLGDAESERVAALNQSLAKTVSSGSDEDENVQIDDIPLLDGAEGEEEQEKRKKEMEELAKLKTLFKGTKVFLNREVPREPLVFMVRAFGGQVSWDSTLANGATFDEDDKTVTHQICDRPRDSIQMKHIGRDYVQPQWVFDSINQRNLLPVHKYFLGETLPPHLSPFLKEETRIGDYVPPEEKKLRGLMNAEEEEEEEEDEAAAGSEVDEEADEEMEEDQNGQEEEDDSDDSEEGEEDVSDGDEDVENEKPKMGVQVGKAEVQPSKEEQEKALNEEQFRLREMMIKKKHKGLYRSMMKARKKRVNESKVLERKRQIHDEAAKKSKSKKPVKHK